MKKWISIVLSVVLVVALVFGVTQYRKRHRAPDREYRTALVERRRIVGKITASGTLQALTTVQVGTQVSGRISNLYVDFNSTVKKGQLVAKIDPLLFEAAVAQSRANYASARAGKEKAEALLREADRVLVRSKALRDQGLASQSDLDAAETAAGTARADLGVATASLAQARANLNQTQVNLSYTSIVAPIDGTVISRNVDVGQTVAASLQAPVLFTIAGDLRKMQVNTNIAEGDVGRLAEGMDATFGVDAFPGERFHGRISQIRNAAQTLQNVVTYDAVIDVDNTDMRLRPGMTANVTVVYEAKDNVLAVPNSALRFRAPSGFGDEGGDADGGERHSRSDGGRRWSHRDGGGERSDGGFTHLHRDGDAGPTDDSDEPKVRTVWMLDGATPVPVRVRVGLSDGSFTEVTSHTLEVDAKLITEVVQLGGTPGGGQGAPPGGSPPGGGGIRRMF